MTVLSTSRRSRSAKQIPVFDDDLEELRVAFHARLQSDRVHFVSLSAALAREEDDASHIFLDLRNRAHKILGGAATLELAEMASAARALELAAIAASSSHAANTDAAVWSALVALVRLLGTLDVGDRALMIAFAD